METHSALKVDVRRNRSRREYWGGLAPSSRSHGLRRSDCDLALSIHRHRPHVVAARLRGSSR
jgi:hypothetical protein